MTADQRGAIPRNGDKEAKVKQLNERCKNSRPCVDSVHCECYHLNDKAFIINVVACPYGYDARIFLNGKVVKELPGNGETFVRSLAEENLDIAITELVDQAKQAIQQGKFTANP